MARDQCQVERFIDSKLGQVKESWIAREHVPKVVEGFRKPLVDVIAKVLDRSASGDDLNFLGCIIELIDVFLNPPCPDIVHSSSAKRKELVYLGTNFIAAFQ